jgi:hypothetical protein
LRGDKSAIRALIEYEMKYRFERVAGADRWTESVLASPVSGRPNAHPVARDFLVFTQCRIERGKLGFVDDPRLTREARQATARMFGLTCDTAVARSRRFSVEQVRRAEERTLDRFVLIHHLDRGLLLTEGLLWGIKFVGDYWAEARGGKIEIEEYEENARRLSLLCRVLDAYQHAHRLEKADTRNATQGLPKRKSH